MTVKELFDKAENNTLTWEQFQAAMGTAKFVDLSEGGYVSKNKYENDMSTKDAQINTLNETLSARDKDLAGLKEQLTSAGTDAEKLTQLTGEFDTLKTKYEADTKAFKAQLKKQAYEFAVKDFANGKKFTSNAAKRDFIQSMIAKDLKFENDKIIGADDFVQLYSAENADAFVAEQSQNSQSNDSQKPQFVNPTQGSEPPASEQNAFMGAFHFTGVRPMNKE